MKLAIIIVVLSVLTIVAVSSDPQVDDQLNKLEGECAKKAGSTLDDAYSLLDRFEIPQSRAAQCFAACLGKKLGFLTADNKLNVGQAKMATTIPALQTAVDACAYMTDADECTAAKKIIECVKMVYTM